MQLFDACIQWNTALSHDTQWHLFWSQLLYVFFRRTLSVTHCWVKYVSKTKNLRFWECFFQDIDNIYIIYSIDTKMYILKYTFSTQRYVCLFKHPIIQNFKFALELPSEHLHLYSLVSKLLCSFLSKWCTMTWSLQKSLLIE